MILFIDDEERRMSSYVEELEFCLEQEVCFQPNVDDALKFLDEPNAEINLIILDVMMPPGKTFEAEDTGYGLKTGLSLYQEIRKKYMTTPIVIFTNTVEDKLLRQKVQSDPHCDLWKKEDYLPHDFATTLKDKFFAD